MIKKTKVFIQVVLLLSITAVANSQNFCEKLEHKRNEIDKLIKSEMKKRQIPALNLGICKGDSLVKIASFGYADIQNLGLTQNDTRFEIASITKQFTASAIILLMQENKLKLKDNICKYIDDCPTTWNAITIKHLLTHTSGLPAMGTGLQIDSSFTSEDFANLLSSKKLTKEFYFNLIDKSTLDFPPGEDFRYSDIGYFLLGYIIENITGSYRSFMQKNIFDPAEMSSTYILDQVSVHKLEARGYTIKNDELVNIRRILDSDIPSHYGIFSNISDLQKWDAVLNSNILFSNESKDLLWKNNKLNNGKSTGYGFGWETQIKKDKLIVSHTGITGTEIIKFVDDEVTFIVLTNLGNGAFDEVNSWGIAQRIAKLLGYKY